MHNCHILDIKAWYNYDIRNVTAEMFEKRGLCAMSRLSDNKTALRLVLAALILVVMGAAGVLLSVSGLYSGSEAAAKSDSTAVTKNTKAYASEENAKLLYSCRVEDVNDTAAVAALLETMKLEDVAGKYAATIRADGDTQAMTIELQESVQKADKKSLDKNMENCAQQIMALMPSVGRVEWTYSLSSTSKEEDETTTVSLDEKAAAKQLSKDVKKYGKSEKAFKKLLIKQAETASAKNK